jgi:predicted O-linked N-acetylglucosamine transferase (SPINDLY family)
VIALKPNYAVSFGIRAKRAQNREVCPPFDNKRFTRHVEAAYATMWGIRSEAKTAKLWRRDGTA